MTYPDFESADFLQGHIESILKFYDPVVFDPSGGFFQHFMDDGQVYDRDTRHLVSSTRFVYNYVNAYLQTGKPKYREWAEHGFAYLLDHHRAADGHYYWQLKGNQIDDGRAMAYGHAFVMLAAAWAARLEINQASQTVAEVWSFMEQHFWQEQDQAYADERDPSLANLSEYRGQNANMHTVEALIAAFNTTKETAYLQRAKAVAHQFCIILAAQADGQIWEHYDLQWRQDWNYNIDKPDDLFKPWGYQPGHQIEWAKLLLQLDELATEDWYLPTALKLFDVAMEKGWDHQHGGLVYGYAPTGEFADANKYFWVHAEALATAWRLYGRTQDVRYQKVYQQIWQWSWDHLVDHQHGAWFRIVSQQGDWLEPYKSPAGKVDYHTMGACWDVLNLKGLHSGFVDKTDY